MKKQFKKSCNRFQDNEQYPCLFSEKLIIEMADHMAEDGFKEAGYEYVSIDVSTYLVTY